MTVLQKSEGNDFPAPKLFFFQSNRSHSLISESTIIVVRMVQSVLFYGIQRVLFDC